MTIHHPPQSDELDEFLTILGDAECRAVLRYFCEASEQASTLTALAGHLTAIDGDTDQTALRLHHRTLPRLDDVGLVDYTPTDHTVRYRAHGRVESWVDAIEEQVTG